MFKRDRVTIIKELDASTTPNASIALLVHVNGNSSLKTTYYNDPEDEYGIVSNVTISLNDVPLIYSRSRACPTCASIIATGHGLEEKEVIRNISNLINKDFISLEQSIQDMSPLLMLLEPGLYVIGDIKHYPTNGMDQFFWNTNNKFEVNNASAPAYLSHFELDHFYFDGTPSYLYPTQHSKFYNSDRVEYYKNRLKNTNNKPRAIVYNFEEYLSLIIDGHHKACAATLLNKSVDTITIMPSTGRSTHHPNSSKQLHYYTFGCFKVLEKEIPRRYQENLVFQKK